MEALGWHLFSLVFILKALHLASPWTISVPSSVNGLSGSCVVIPCTFNYPETHKTITGFTGMWLDEGSHPIFHSVSSKTASQYKGRTQLLGDLRQKNCSLMIEPLLQSDTGPFHFRIEMQGYDNYSYKARSVTITMINRLPPIIFTIKEEVEDHPANTTCSVIHCCPNSLPVFTWNHLGRQQTVQRQIGANQWEVSSTLTFHPTPADNNKHLQCRITYRGGQNDTSIRVLKVKYAPVKVEVESKSAVKEGEAVTLKCTSDANPPASYEWHSDKGAQLHKGNIYTLTNVSRHMGTLYCTAINKIGRRKSGVVQLNLLYGPEIKAFSSCSSDGALVKCVCMAESRPPSTVQFLLHHTVLPSKVERHGPITVGTVQADASSFSFVYCVANNTLGTTNITLALAANKKDHNLYIGVGVGAGVIVAALLIVGIKKWNSRGRLDEVPESHMTTMADKLPKHSSAASHRKDLYDDTYPSRNCSDHIYGNMQAGCSMDDEIYANM